MKKTILILFIFAIFLSIIVDSYNSSNKTNEVDGKKEGIEIYSHEDLATLPLEKTYTYEDVLEDMKGNGLDTEERIVNFKSQHEDNIRSIAPNSAEIVRYAKFSMDSYKFTSSFKEYELIPTIYIGLYYTTSTSPDRIASIAEPFVTTPHGSDYVFIGEIFHRLESGNSFYYGINGDVYKPANVFVKNIDFDGRYYSSSLNH